MKVQLSSADLNYRYKVIGIINSQDLVPNCFIELTLEAHLNRWADGPTKITILAQFHEQLENGIAIQTLAWNNIKPDIAGIVPAIAGIVPASVNSLGRVTSWLPISNTWHPIDKIAFKDIIDVKKIPLNDLPLYLGYDNKSPMYEQILKEGF